MNKRSFRRKKIAMGVFVAASSSPPAFADICFISDSLSAPVCTPGWVTSSPIPVGSLPGKTEMLTIKNGGQLTTGGGSFGLVNDSTGSGVVEGAGSAWTINDVLYIGNQGNGSLKILGGGAVINNDDSTYIGFGSDSNGYLEVGDADSQFTAPAGTLTVGESGAGIVTVSKGGAVSAAEITLAGQTGSTGVLNIGSAEGMSPSSAGYINSQTVNFGSGSSTINFNHTAEDYLFSPRLSGNGRVNVYSGTTILAARNTYSGSTEVQGGRLAAGAEDAFSANSDYLVSGNGELALNGFHQTVGNLDNAGIVNIAGISVGTVLTVNGDYSGENGLLVFNSALGGDDSVTDRMVITGNATGTSFVKVNNLGGSGAATLNGIKLIEIQGNADGEFIQQGRIVAGAYDYRMINAGSDWYLSAETTAIPVPDPEPIPEPAPVPEPAPTPEPTPTPEPAPVPEPVPAPAQPSAKKQILRPEGAAYAANMAATLSLFDSRQSDRQGAFYYDALTGEQKYTSMWLTVVGGHARAHDESGQLRTTSHRYATMLGGSLASTENWRAGVLAGYGNSRSNSVSDETHYRAKGEVTGYTAGLYATWYAAGRDKGLWVDGVVQYSWFKNTVSGEDISSEHYRTQGISASLETGYVVPIAQSVRNSVFIQPQAGLAWSGLSDVEDTEQNGTRVAGGVADTVRSRLGLKAYMKSHAALDDRTGRSFRPYIEANWLHSTQDFGVTMDGASVIQAGSRNIAELKAGVEGYLNGRVNVSGNIGQQAGNHGWSDTSVSLAVKLTF